MKVYTLVYAQTTTDATSITVTVAVEDGTFRVVDGEVPATEDPQAARMLWLTFLQADNVNIRVFGGIAAPGDIAEIASRDADHIADVTPLAKLMCERSRSAMNAVDSLCSAILGYPAHGDVDVSVKLFYLGLALKDIHNATGRVTNIIAMAPVLGIHPQDVEACMSSGEMSDFVRQRIAWALTQAATVSQWLINASFVGFIFPEYPNASLMCRVDGEPDLRVSLSLITKERSHRLVSRVYTAQSPSESLEGGLLTFRTKNGGGVLVEIVSTGEGVPLPMSIGSDLVGVQLTRPGSGKSRDLVF